MQATQAQRVVSAIATILPEGGPGRSPPRYLRENEAQDLAAVSIFFKITNHLLDPCINTVLAPLHTGPVLKVCEEWLRSVAAEQVKLSGLLLGFP